ncbi:MAG: GNAT family N-acetyltransferase, partial [Actinomycetota bacterium]|nr:GNAT family N-acetyltransferase [Actinomycetota bacterium]
FRALAVAGWAQGRGVGGRLVDACVAQARARGCRRMLIASLPWMTVAHGLYERRGFVRRPDLDVMFPEGHGMVFTLDLTADAADHFPPPGVVPQPLPWWRDVWVTPADLVRRAPASRAEPTA